MSEDPTTGEPGADGDLGGRDLHEVRSRIRWADRPRLAVAGAAAVIRIVAALILSRKPVGLHDPLLYQRFAQGIAKGQGYVSFYGKPTSYYPPGYPFFLGALQWICDRLSISGSLPIVSGLAQALLGGVIVWAVIGVGERLRRDPARTRLGLVAGVIVAIWPNLVLHSTVLLSETLFLTVFSLFLLTIVRAIQAPTPARLLGAGLLLGLSVLVRPQVVLVMAAVAVVALLAKRSWPQRVAIV